MTVNNPKNGLLKLTKDRVKEACKVAGAAFKDDPVMVFTYPDERVRKEKAQYGFYMIYRYGIKYGLAYTTSNNLDGIIIWLPPDKGIPSFWTMMRNGGFYTMRKSGLNIKALKRTMKIFRYQEERHKALAPFKHWYFENIAVKPEEQGKGYGGLLISSIIKKVEGDGLPIFVETNTEKAASIYQKYGFEVLEHTIIPDTPVPLWCMLRKPR